MRNRLLIALALLDALFAETLTGDAMYLAVMRAGDSCAQMGIPKPEISRIMSLLIQRWANQRRHNPISGMC